MANTRRDFLKTISLAGAILPLADQFPFPIPAPTERKLRVALIGLGSYATHQLAPGLLKSKNCELAGIVTGSPEKAATWKEKYNLLDKNIYNYQNFDDIAKNPDIDVVYVVLPNSMHHEFVLRAAKAGKHVITEKPMRATRNLRSVDAGIGKGNWSASGRIAPARDIVFRKSRLVFAIVQSHFLLKIIVL